VDEVMARVAKCVGEVLARDATTIRAGDRLMEDLGAESLDLVELMFALEQEFDIRLERDDLSLTAQLGLPEPEIHDHEVLTPRALELLRDKFPGARDLLVPGVTRKHLGALVTVEEIARAVRRKMPPAQ
jgi:acyl carrier protein